MSRLSILVVSGLVLSGAMGKSSAAADNWPQWHGPDANGVAQPGDYPIEFSADKNVDWKVDLPGKGSSTPAVWDDSIFVTCGIDGQDGLLCYDLEGNKRWRRLLGPEMPGKHPHGSGSNPSPATDGRHVVVFYKSGTLACFDFEGQELWRHNLREKYGDINMWWDLGTSPVIAGGRAIISVLHAGDSYLLALDLDTGEVLWKQPRQYQCPTESDQAYTTPSVLPIGGQNVIVTWGADHLTGHAVDTGELLWECGGFNPENKGSWRAIASAAVADGLAVVPYGRGDFLAAVRLDGAGDVTDTHRLWEKHGLGADVPTPAVRDGRVYLLTDRGRIACLDLQSGDELWSADLPKSRHSYFASPVLAGNLFYSAREDGTVFVGRISDDGYEPLAENPMGEDLVVGPVPVRGGLLIRGPEHLYRIGAPTN